MARLGVPGTTSVAQAWSHLPGTDPNLVGPQDVNSAHLTATLPGLTPVGHLGCRPQQTAGPRLLSAQAQEENSPHPGLLPHPAAHAHAQEPVGQGLRACVRSIQWPQLERGQATEASQGLGRLLLGQARSFLLFFPPSLLPFLSFPTLSPLLLLLLFSLKNKKNKNLIE